MAKEDGKDEDSFLGHRFVDEGYSYVESGTNLEEESEGKDNNTALELIMDNTTYADNEALVETFNGDDLAEHEDRDDNEPPDEVNNKLPIEQPGKQKFKNLDEDKY